MGQSVLLHKAKYLLVIDQVEVVSAPNDGGPKSCLPWVLGSLQEDVPKLRVPKGLMVPIAVPLCSSTRDQGPGSSSYKEAQQAHRRSRQAGEHVPGF